MKHEIARVQQQKKLLISDVSKDIDLMKTHLLGRIMDMPDDNFAYLSEFISPKQAAKMIGVSLPTLNKYVESGLIQRYALARKRYYRRDEIKRVFFNDFLNKVEVPNGLSGHGSDR
jgi:hypothetical protein